MLGSANASADEGQGNQKKGPVHSGSLAENPIAVQMSFRLRVTWARFDKIFLPAMSKIPGRLRLPYERALDTRENQKGETT